MQALIVLKHSVISWYWSVIGPRKGPMGCTPIVCISGLVLVANYKIFLEKPWESPSSLLKTWHFEVSSENKGSNTPWGAFLPFRLKQQPGAQWFDLPIMHWQAASSSLCLYCCLLLGSACPWWQNRPWRPPAVGVNTIWSETGQRGANKHPRAKFDTGDRWHTLHFWLHTWKHLWILVMRNDMEHWILPLCLLTEDCLQIRFRACTTIHSEVHASSKVRSILHQSLPSRLSNPWALCKSWTSMSCHLLIPILIWRLLDPAKRFHSFKVWHVKNREIIWGLNWGHISIKVYEKNTEAGHSVRRKYAHKVSSNVVHQWKILKQYILMPRWSLAIQFVVCRIVVQGPSGIDRNAGIWSIKNAPAISQCLPGLPFDTYKSICFSTAFSIAFAMTVLRNLSLQCVLIAQQSSISSLALLPLDVIDDSVRAKNGLHPSSISPCKHACPV